ncbi:MAG: hypothetical protein ABIO14_12460 [Aeromicrobium sp.]
MGKENKGLIHLWRRHWSEELLIVFLVVAASVTCLGFVRYGHLEKNPWGYIATAVAIFAALSGMVLTIAEAMRESSVDD